MRNGNLGVVTLLAVASLVGACGGDEDTTAAGAATTTASVGGSGGVSSGGAGGTGGSPGGGGGTGGEAPSAAPLLLGAHQFVTASGPLWQANLLSYLESDPTRRCNFQQVDNCNILDCRASTYGAQEPRWVSVGPVTFSDGSNPDIVLEPDGDNIYWTETGSSLRWPVGSVISISAPGDELPGFDVEVTTSSAVDLLSPDIESLGDGELTIPLTSAFTVTWTPTDEKVGVELLESNSGAVSETSDDIFDVYCQFDGASGTGAIPADLVGRLVGGMSTSLFCAGHGQETRTTLGARPLWYSASSYSCRSVEFE